MLGNYIKIALRNIRKQLVYSVINIFGLALGITSSLIILLFVINELSYDRQFRDSDKIYRISTSFMNLGNFANGPEVLLNTFPGEYPIVEDYTRFDTNNKVEINIGGQQFVEFSPYFADSTFFRFFSYDFIHGDPLTALDEPNEVVISAPLAEKYFGSTDVLGETMFVGKEKELFRISGVVAPLKAPSHMNGRIWFPVWTRFGDEPNWTSAYYYNYVKVREGVSESELQVALDELVRKKVYPERAANLTYEEWLKTDNAYKLTAMPLHDIYLDSKLKFEVSPGGNRDHIYIFSAVAFFIIVIAIVNFINLTTARSVTRAREVGIRKTMGSSRLRLMVQFMGESVIYSLIAFVVSLSLFELFVLVLENYVGQLTFNKFISLWQYLPLGLLISLLVGILAGLYPSFILSRFKPSSVLKSSFQPGGTHSMLRNILVVFQFVVSVGLILGSLIIMNQIDYLRNKDIGLNRESVLVIDNFNKLDGSKSAFKNTLSGLPAVHSISESIRIPAGRTVWIHSFRTRYMDNSVTFNAFPVDEHYLETLGIQLIDGRNFDPEIASDSNAVILNEAAVKELMLEDPLNEYLNDDLKIIGIVKNFNFESFKKDVQPVALTYPSSGGRLAIRLQKGHEIQPVLSDINHFWSDLQVDEPVSYYFLDNNFEQLMEKEKQLSRTIMVFTILAVIISCLGLFGLSSYLTALRSREAGVRKSFGATARQIMMLFNRRFIIPVLLAIAVSVPLTIWIMGRWLQDFAYQAPISWTLVTITSVVTVLISILAVSYHSIMIARVNPARILREE